MDLVGWVVAATRMRGGAPPLHGSPEASEKLSSAWPFYPGGGDSIVNPEVFQEVTGQPWTSSPGVRVEVGGRQDLTGSQRCPFTSSP